MDLKDKLHRTEILNDPVRCEILMLIGEYFSLTFEELFQHLKTVQPTVQPEELEKELEVLGNYVLKTQDKKLTKVPPLKPSIMRDVADYLSEKFSTPEARDMIEPVEKYVLSEDGRDTLDEMLTSKYY